MKFLATTLYRIMLLLGFMLLLSNSAIVTPAQEETAPAWDSESRLTILVMGMDRRPDERDSLEVRTDAIFLVSLDPEKNTVGILHLPRDLHIAPVSGDNFLRVNLLMRLGEELQPGFGPYFAMDTLQYNLGLYIDRYVLFDFEAFMTLVDAIGGVEITTDVLINDPTYPDMNYGYDPFYLPIGTHILDGHRALQFARTRHGDNDFLRGGRQLQLLLAIQRQISENDQLDDLVRQSPDLYAALDGNFYSDLSLNDMIQLALYINDLPAENIRTDAIDTDYNLSYGLPDGSVVYIPDRARLAELLTDVFGENYSQP